MQPEIVVLLGSPPHDHHGGDEEHSGSDANPRTTQVRFQAGQNQHAEQERWEEGKRANKRPPVGQQSAEDQTQQRQWPHESIKRSPATNGHHHETPKEEGDQEPQAVWKVSECYERRPAYLAQNKQINEKEEREGYEELTPTLSECSVKRRSRSNKPPGQHNEQWHVKDINHKRNVGRSSRERSTSDSPVPGNHNKHGDQTHVIVPSRTFGRSFGRFGHSAL